MCVPSLYNRMKQRRKRRSRRQEREEEELAAAAFLYLTLSQLASAIDFAFRKLCGEQGNPEALKAGKRGNPDLVFQPGPISGDLPGPVNGSQ